MRVAVCCSDCVYSDTAHVFGICAKTARVSLRRCVCAQQIFASQRIYVIRAAFAHSFAVFAQTQRIPLGTWGAHWCIVLDIYIYICVYVRMFISLCPVCTSDRAHIFAQMCSLVYRTATHCNTLPQTATHRHTLQHVAAHCNTLHALQHTATHCNTLQHTATHCHTLQHVAAHCNTLHALQQRHSAYLCADMCCSVLQCVDVLMQQTATHCNTYLCADAFGFLPCPLFLSRFDTLFQKTNSKRNGQQSEWQ